MGCVFGRGLRKTGIDISMLYLILRTDIHRVPYPDDVQVRRTCSGGRFKNPLREGRPLPRESSARKPAPL